MADTLMWEARAVPGGRDALARWVVEHVAGPADVYLGGQDRVVVIARGAGRLPEPPADLVARPVAQWPFTFHRSV
ncbi:hypothetical protein [Amycolatopsis thermoflava]|uniref:Uncharacterized protein n=1 Tax=Amycolatopsis thermoflava TaxID=84480 RepID=A0A3N2H0Q1_9PSEU|nr:hypothetical protein [Amycolatopsis thermoflava]ROS42502.1 hypothetical protein EDD35_4892 [Amycolatopsis thermoflava]